MSSLIRHDLVSWVVGAGLLGALVYVHRLNSRSVPKQLLAAVPLLRTYGGATWYVGRFRYWAGGCVRTDIYEWGIRVAVQPLVLRWTAPSVSLTWDQFTCETRLSQRLMVRTKDGTLQLRVRCYKFEEALALIEGHLRTSG